ncbi:MAG: SpoIIIAH-like family protein [Thermacetogeniaceae bacterium]
MVSIALSRKRVIIFFLVVAALCLSFLLLRSGTGNRKLPVEVKVEQKNGVSGKLPHAVKNLNEGDKEFFVEYRLNRERLCSKQIELLKEIAENPDSSAEIRESAQRDMIQITENLGKETEIEKLIIAQGFDDAVVMLQPKAAMVVVRTPSLLQSDTERIKDIISRTTGLGEESVFVFAKP